MNLSMNVSSYVGTSIDRSAVIAMEVINIITAFICVWILVAKVIYGLKNGLYRKKMGGSSLSSGLMYGSATVAIALALPCYVLNEIHLQLFNKPNWKPYCELLCDASTVAYMTLSVAVYLVLWINQRLIFVHPYVKTQMPVFVNRLSQVYCVPMLLSCGVVLYFYVAPDDYAWDSSTCIPGTEEIEMSTVLAIILMSITYVVPAFSVYAALRVNFGYESQASGSSTDESDLPNAPQTKPWANCCGSFAGTHSRYISPIQMAVRRNVICCIVVVLIDITSLAISEFGIHRDAGQPMIITWTLYGCVLVFKVIAVLALMGPLKKITSIVMPICHCFSYDS